MEGGWRNKIALPTMRALGIPVMNTWNSSATLWSYHYNYKVRSAQPGCPTLDSMVMQNPNS